MMTLIALAISVAYFYSVAITFLGGKDTLFWELATLITIMLLGTGLKCAPFPALKARSKNCQNFCRIRRKLCGNGKVEIVSLSEIKKGDIVLVKPGGRIPADGKVKEGISDVDESSPQASQNRFQKRRR